MTNRDSEQAAAPPGGALTKAAYGLYGVVAWLVFTILALGTLALVLVLPGIGLRRRVTGGGARLFLGLMRMPLEVRGLEHLPAGQCIVVANHASYLDGVVMKAALPPRFAYVVKREMASFPLAGLLLRRIGTEFVERLDRQKGASDTRRVMRTASGGQALVFFPEGTFSNERGLLKFQSGAFITAARAGCPVVPGVIVGSREILPGSRALPRPGRILVEFMAPIVPAGRDAAPELRDRSRRLILDRLGEPDLAA